MSDTCLTYSTELEPTTLARLHALAVVTGTKKRHILTEAINEYVTARSKNPHYSSAQRTALERYTKQLKKKNAKKRKSE